ncbi:MAG: aminotransferase class III-fold pyridoxal phosphate-dependent enzyme, partial [Bdellovibrionales bacterium]|nr:aminotransferase class III-fold pyridoxal phosphate-dependent enzyme [Bdellovibrionales bacterium]
GDTFGSMSVSERCSFTLPFVDLLFEVCRIPSPTLEGAKKAFEALSLLIQTSDDLVAFIYEPLLQAAGGMVLHSAAALSELLSLCKQHNILTIADEVMTGFGRTGTLFASEQLQMPPDIICMSKGITGGFLPLGATSCTHEIFDSFASLERKKFFFHGHSYSGNPIACSAGVASFDLLMTEHSQNQRNMIANKHLAAMEAFSTATHLQHPRSLGTLIAVDVQGSEPTGYHHSRRDEIYQHFIERGILMRPLGNTIYVLPPYCISEGELDSCYAAMLQL